MCLIFQNYSCLLICPCYITGCMSIFPDREQIFSIRDVFQLDQLIRIALPNFHVFGFWVMLYGLYVCHNSVFSERKIYDR
jgi:hypothetical protein